MRRAVLALGVLAVSAGVGCGGPAPARAPESSARAPGAAPPPDEAAALLERFRTCASPETPATCAAGLERAATLDEAAHRTGRAIEARRIALALGGVDAGTLARNAYQLGTDYRNIAEFELAATALERAATLDPGGATAAPALTDAIALRLGLGDGAAVAADCDRFFARPGPIDAELAAKVAFVRGAWANEHGDPAGAERELSKAMVTIDRGPLWLRLTAHAMLAKALARHATDGRAAAEWARVRELGAGLKPSAADADPRSFAKGIMAIGDAIVFQADQKRLAAKWSPVPAYGGGAASADIDRWVSASIAPWVTGRTTTIAELESAYRAVLDLTPVPPPNAVVVAGARVAALWSDAADALSAASFPRAWDGAKRKLFAERLATAGATLIGKAKAANVWCTSVAVKFQYVAPEAGACSDWLTKRWPHEYPKLDELQLLPAPRVGGGTLVAPLPEP